MSSATFVALSVLRNVPLGVSSVKATQMPASRSSRNALSRSTRPRAMLRAARCSFGQLAGGEVDACHRADDLVRRGLRDGLREHTATAPHDGHAVGHFEDVRERVRDKITASSRSRHPVHERENVRGLLRRESGDRLVEDQHAPAPTRRARPPRPAAGRPTWSRRGSSAWGCGCRARRARRSRAVASRGGRRSAASRPGLAGRPRGRGRRSRRRRESRPARGPGRPSRCRPPVLREG